MARLSLEFLAQALREASYLSAEQVVQLQRMWRDRLARRIFETIGTQETG